VGMVRTRVEVRVRYNVKGNSVAIWGGGETGYVDMESSRSSFKDPERMTYGTTATEWEGRRQIGFVLLLSSSRIAHCGVGELLTTGSVRRQRR